MKFILEVLQNFYPQEQNLNGFFAPGNIENFSTFLTVRISIRFILSFPVLMELCNYIATWVNRGARTEREFGTMLAKK